MNVHTATVPSPPADLHGRPLHSVSPGTQSCHGMTVMVDISLKSAFVHMLLLCSTSISMMTKCLMAGKW